jgi:hypothetical protein
LTDSAISFAKLITELPTAARNEMHKNVIQKDGWQSIFIEVKSFCSLFFFLFIT